MFVHWLQLAMNWYEIDADSVCVSWLNNIYNHDCQVFNLIRFNILEVQVLIKMNTYSVHY